MEKRIVEKSEFSTRRRETSFLFTQYIPWYRSYIHLHKVLVRWERILAPSVPEDVLFFLIVDISGIADIFGTVVVGSAMSGYGTILALLTRYLCVIDI